MYHQVRARPRTGSSSAVSRRAAAASICFTLLFVGACSDSATPPTPIDAPSSLRLTMLVSELDRGDTTRASAVVLNGSGTPIASPGAGLPRNVAPVVWTSSDPSIADVSRSGLILAQRGGEVTITAKSGNLASAARVQVKPRGKLVTVSPRVDTLSAIGHTVQLTATVLNNSGRQVVNPDVTWSSLNPEIAEVNSTGIVRAIATGTALVFVAASGGADTARVVVSGLPPVGQLPPVPAVGSVEVAPGDVSVDVGRSGQFKATVRDGSGGVVSGAQVVWSSSDTDVVTIDAQGVAASRTPGVAVIRATLEGKSGTSTITVTGSSSSSASFPAVVEVAPATATVEVGRTVQLGATVRDQNGQPMSGVPVTWSSGNTALATVSASGLVSGVAGGITSVRATAGDVSGFSAVTVMAPPASPPPGGGVYQNQPAGLTAIAHTDFNCLPRAGGCTGQMGSWGGNYDGNHHYIQSDPTVPSWYPGSKNVFVARFAPGHVGATGNGGFATSGWPSGQYRKLYTYMLIKHEGDAANPHLYENHPTGAKQGWWSVASDPGTHYYASNELFPLIMSRSGPVTAGTTALRSEFNLDFQQQNGPWRAADVTGTVRVNQWNVWEFYYELNDIGQANGKLRWWVNGELRLSSDNWVFRTAARPAGFWAFYSDATFGHGEWFQVGMGNGAFVRESPSSWNMIHVGQGNGDFGRVVKQQNSYMKYAHVYFSGEPLAR